MIQQYPQSSAAVLYSAVRNLLARSAAFQTFADAADESAAAERIYFEGFPESPANGKEYGKSEYNSWLPCAIVRLPYNDAGMRGTLTDFSSSFDRNGSVDVIFECSVPTTRQRASIPKPEFMFDFVTHMGQILDELILLRGQPDESEKPMFDFNSYAFLTFLYTPAEKVPQTGLNIQAIFTLDYGRDV